ncbi:LysR family transcriptional regulator [Variovorax sp. J2P1-59]|uniref:LysR family transcriptional regulator n=1 Tax=Variovorax flavidus TaxID=3053501 RepID=UPI002574DD00|nr:LysR family transcriptional regulator [Variovorax sp. J2P1-59]MDM0078585.1 LysR family transcriptional regulator [Variovorax sp. J2P1-59]
MNPIDLGRIDLNLLTVFAALMQERHVSRAAQRLHVGQPAVSYALGRLRALTSDVLFVRQGRLMEPTPRALALMEGLRPALDQIETTLRAQSEFDRRLARPVFRIGMTDDLQICILPRLLRLLRAEVPLAQLIVATVSHRDAMRQLQEGRVDTVMAYLQSLPADAKVRQLGSTRYVVLRADHAAPPMTLDEFCTRPHALVTFAEDVRGFVDDALESMGRRRHVVVSIPQFGSVPSVLAGTDLLATVPAYLAEELCSRACLRQEPLPFRSPEYSVSMCWRAAVDKDGAQMWLRDALNRAYQSDAAA